MDIDKRYQVISQAMKESGAMLLDKFKIFDRGQVRFKAANEIVTEFDLMSEQIILSAIKNNFPNDAILSEETGANDKDSDWQWVVDPIDGTTNFSMHSPLWCISVGLLYEKEIVLGLVFIPVLDELYVAKKGQGASLNGQLIKVSTVKEGKVLNSFCWGRGNDQTLRMIDFFKQQKIHGFGALRHLGTAATELAYVASGRLDSFVLPSVKLWDVAAGILLVKEAGGMITDFENNPWTLTSQDLLASNGLVHEALVKGLKDSQYAGA